jgi:hypothetical protein
MIHCENNFEKDPGNKEFIQLLIDTAETISACGKDIQKTAENIMAVCHIPGTKGAAYGNQLLAKVDDLKKLAVLHSTASKKLISAVCKITNGMPEDEVLSDIIVFSNFYTDQLKCEEDELHHILCILRGVSQNNPESLKA